MRFELPALVLALGLAGPAFAEAPSIFDYRLGDHTIDYPLSELDVISSDLDGFEGQAFIKVNAPNLTEVALTFRSPQNTLQYLEHDWVNRSATAPTALRLPGIPEFTFGETRVSDVQLALGQQGFHYACRQLQSIPGGVLTFVSFDLPAQPDAIYTFVAEYSRDLEKRGLVDFDNIDLTQAVLVAAIVSRANYLEDFWCRERIPYTSTPKFFKAPSNESFKDFLPAGAGVIDDSPWEVVSDPLLMITKNGAVTWGDRLFIVPDPTDCSRAEFMVWAHTFDDSGLLALEGQKVEAAFNLLAAEQTRAPLQSPVPLAHALYAPINDRAWPPFAVGSFVFGSYDFERIIAADGNAELFGFSLEFQNGAAGMRDNYWSLDGLSEAGNDAMRICREKNQ